jgi:hypothetical protein
MSTQQPSPQERRSGPDPWLLLVAVLLAWPALLLGALLRKLIKRDPTRQHWYWVSLGLLGAGGLVFLVTRANPYPLLPALVHDLVGLFLHAGPIALKRLVEAALPVWERSLLLMPGLTLVLELFGPKNFRATLLTQERQRKAIQIRQSQRAARKAGNAPDQIKGQAVLGALIDNPNN